MTRVSKDIREVLDGTNKEDNDECYTTGETTTINFIKADGSEQMFPYAQLITAWTEHTDEENVIKVFFATHLVTIKGLNLSVIYEALTNQNLISVLAQDKRYFITEDEKKAFAKEIRVEWKAEANN